MFLTFLSGSELCPGIYVVHLIAFCALSMVNVFGMWEGAKWSWWTMTFLQTTLFWTA